LRLIEIRRHAYTKKGVGRGRGSHLSAEGVQLARTIGEPIGPFDLVLTSEVQRTLETAIAMGFAVDEQLQTLGDISEEVVAEIGHHERWTWEAPFARFAEVVVRGGSTAMLAQSQREAWQRALESVPSNGSVLIISHGRVIEAGVVACLPNEDFASWGAPFSHCEGMRLQYEGGKFMGWELLRV
jgi:broad specificity phosphatase PhoE